MTKRLLRRYAEPGVFYEDTGEKLQQSGSLSELARYESWAMTGENAVEEHSMTSI